MVTASVYLSEHAMAHGKAFSERWSTERKGLSPNTNRIRIVRTMIHKASGLFVNHCTAVDLLKRYLTETSKASAVLEHGAANHRTWYYC